MAKEAAALPLDTKRVLGLVVSHLNGPDGKQLWDILSALRGPDSSDTNLKLATTSRLRHAIGMKGTISNGGNLETSLQVEEGEPFGANLSRYYHITDEVRRRFPEVDGHFAYHYSEAVIALRTIGLLPEPKV